MDAGTRRSGNTDTLLEVTTIRAAAPVDIQVRSPDNQLLFFLSRPAEDGELRCPRGGMTRFAPAMPMRFRPAEIDYELRGLRGEARLLRITFGNARLFELMGGVFDWREAEIARALDLSSSRLSPLLLRIADELTTPTAGSSAIVDAMATMAIVELVRHARGAAPDDRDGAPSPLSLDRIRRRIGDPDRPIPSVSELSASCGVSERTLLRQFRDATGQSVSAYLRRAQMMRARRLLTGDLPLKEIAFRLDFAQPSGFIAAFRRATGETPAQFRRRLRRGVDGDELP